jgi:hypothetical protein
MLSTFFVLQKGATLSADVAKAGQGAKAAISVARRIERIVLGDQGAGAYKSRSESLQALVAALLSNKQQMGSARHRDSFE